MEGRQVWSAVLPLVSNITRSACSQSTLRGSGNAALQQTAVISSLPSFNVFRYGRELEDTGDRVRVSQQWTDDDIVIHLR